MMRIDIQSFGFKHGIPEEANLVVDVRFLANPYHVPELKPLDGESEAVRAFVLNNEDARTFLSSYFQLLDLVLPMYIKEGRDRLTLAVGCVGGRHRSVVIAREIRAHLAGAGKRARLVHRELERSRGTAAFQRA
ncbi:MAG: hypothetical protein GY859_10860 [Desulfobacterales bacterium]|nr:hypothetical protein [Desulfobacterales bacterium]